MSRHRDYSDDDTNDRAEFGPSDGRKEKRRRDIIERVERLRREGIEHKEIIFQELLNNLHNSHLSLLTLPHPTHPNYLLRLSELSIERDIQLSANQVHYKFQQETLKSLYAQEVQRVEEEYATAKKAAKERLLEACDERARKLREEKEGIELNLESFFETQQPRPHATRQHRVARKFADQLLLGNGDSYANPPSNQATRASSVALPLNGSSSPATAAEQASALTQGTPGELFPFSLLPASPLLSSFQLSNNGGPALLNPAALLSTLAAIPTQKRTKRGDPKLQPAKDANGQVIMAVAGLPTNLAQYSVQPGKYDFMGKSLYALKALGADDVSEDLEGLRSGGFKKRRTNAAYADSTYLSSVGMRRRGGG